MTITGGKLTTYRVMARQTVDVLAKVLGTRGSAATGSTPFAETPEPGGNPIVRGLPWRTGAIRRGIEAEFACTLGDLLIRRTHIAFQTRDNGRAVARAIAPEVASLLRWDDARTAKELERFDAEVSRIFSIDH